MPPLRVTRSINVHTTCCAWAQGRRKQLKSLVPGLVLENSLPSVGRCLDLWCPRLPPGPLPSVLWASHHSHHPSPALLQSGFLSTGQISRCQEADHSKARSHTIPQDGLSKASLSGNKRALSQACGAAWSWWTPSHPPFSLLAPLHPAGELLPCWAPSNVFRLSGTPHTPLILVLLLQSRGGKLGLRHWAADHLSNLSFLPWQNGKKNNSPYLAGRLPWYIVLKK